MGKREYYEIDPDQKEAILALRRAACELAVFREHAQNLRALKGSNKTMYEQIATDIHALAVNFGENPSSLNEMAEMLARGDGRYAL